MLPMDDLAPNLSAFQKDDFMFRPIAKQPDRPIKIQFESQMIKASSDDTVAAALLRAGILQFRYATAQDPRGPFCMMGTCFDCLVEIDGKPNRQACQTIVRNGMVVRRQQAPVAAAPDERTKP